MKPLTDLRFDSVESISDRKFERGERARKREREREEEAQTTFFGVARISRNMLDCQPLNLEPQCGSLVIVK